MENKNPRKQLKPNKKSTMNMILIFLFVTVLLFTVIMIWVYVFTGGIPDTLCTCFFAFCGGECGVMGWIKTIKDKEATKMYQFERKVDSDDPSKEERNNL